MVLNACCLLFLSACVCSLNICPPVYHYFLLCLFLLHLWRINVFVNETGFASVLLASEAHEEVKITCSDVIGLGLRMHVSEEIGELSALLCVLHC